MRLTDGLETFRYACPSTQICAVDLSTTQLLWSKPKVVGLSRQLSRFLIKDDKAYGVFDLRSTPTIHQTNVQAYDLGTGVNLYGGSGTPGAYVADTPGWRPIWVNGLVLVGGESWGHTWPVGEGVTFAYVEVNRLFENLFRRPARQEKYGARGGTYMAVANGYLITSVPEIRVTTFDRS